MEKNKIFGLVIILLLIPLFYFGYQIYSGELQFKTVLSGSMSPTINAGDVVLISGINPEEIKEQDIITFREGETFTTHRVVEIVNNTFRTKGDANEDPDTKLVKTEQVVGKVVFTIPFLGYFGHFVRTIPGFLIFILIPGILIIYSEIKKIKGEVKPKEGYEGGKDKIHSGIKTRIFGYSQGKRNLLIYLACIFSVSLIVFSPFYTGAFFSDTELSLNNTFQAEIWGDETSPTTKTTAVREDGTDYTFGKWINSTYVNVTLNCSAPDCNTTLYCNDTNNSCEPNLTYQKPINISAQGTTYLRFRSNDSAGNNESVKNKTIKIDQTTPNATVNSPPISNSTNFSLNFTYEDSIGEIECIELWYFGINSSNLSSNCKNKLLSGNLNELVIQECNGELKELVIPKCFEDLFIYENYQNYTELSGNFESNYTKGVYFFYALGVDKAGNRETPLSSFLKFETLTVVYNSSSCNEKISTFIDKYYPGSGGTGNKTETSDFSINLTYPTNNSYTNKNTTEFNFTVSGSETSYNCTLYLNDTSKGNNASVSNNTATIITSSAISDGFYNWHINCTAVGTTEQSEVREITIDTTNPNISITHPSLNSLVNNHIINGTSTDLTLNYTNISIKQGGTIINSTTNSSSNWEVSLYAPDGVYNITAIAYDGVGYSNSTTNTNITIGVPPTIQFVPPTTEAGGHPQDWISANVTASDTNFDTLTLSLYNSTGLYQENKTSDTQIYINYTGLPEDNYYLNATANDTAGNTKTKTREIILDTTNPTISITYPDSNSITNNHIINGTSSDPNLNYTNISIKQDNTTINSTINTSENWSVSLYAPDGTYNITATVYDLAGNQNLTGVENITIDTTPPEIQFVTPTTETGNHSQDWISANVTASDSGVGLGTINLTLWNSTGPYQQNTTSNTNIYINYTDLPEDNYYLNATANDTFGNQNSTTLENITVDTTPPEISNPKINNTPISVNSSVKLNATITDFVGVDTVIFNITTPYRNLTLDAIKGTNNEYFIICNATNECKTNQAGVYNWTKIWANDTPGNSNSTDPSLYFNVTGEE